MLIVVVLAWRIEIRGIALFIGWSGSRILSDGLLRTKVTALLITLSTRCRILLSSICAFLPTAISKCDAILLACSISSSSIAGRFYGSWIDPLFDIITFDYSFYSSNLILSDLETISNLAIVEVVSLTFVQASMTYISFVIFDFNVIEVEFVLILRLNFCLGRIIIVLEVAKDWNYFYLTVNNQI